ncbi:MAG: peptide deformylase [Fuerstiella sp.]|nr:peptide deformylase [Fuerstiella sp.]
MVNFPHPALRWKSKDVNRIDAQLKNWIAQMFDLMYAARGIGLAANQVGLPYRLFVINPSADPAEKELEQVFINPQIIKRNGSEDAEEGCLSLPEIYGPVTRAERITVEAFDLTGENFAYELGGIHARVVQHESDHLDGVMFTDKISADALVELQPLLDDMTAQMERQQQEGQLASNDELLAELRRLQAERTDG